MTRFLTAILNWLREGYPEGIPPTDYLPVLALLPRHIESASEYDPRADLRNRDSAAVKAALAVSCQVCEAGLGEDCQNLTNGFRLRCNESFIYAGCPFPPTAGSIITN